MENENDEKSGGEPEGKSTPPDREEYLRKLVSQRDLYKGKARDLEAKTAEKDTRIAELEKELAAKSQIESAFGELKAKFERRNVEDQLLGDLPRAKRETASLLLDGLMARGEVSLDGTEESVAKARERLAALIPDFGSDTTPPHQPPQNRGPSPTPPSAPATQGADPTSAPGFWKQYQHFLEVPPDLRSKIPTHEWNRLCGS